MERISLWWRIIHRRSVAIVFSVFALIGLWDTAQSQMFPKSWQMHTPRVFDVVAGLPWWAWMPIGLGFLTLTILVGASHELEELQRRLTEVSTDEVSESIATLDHLKRRDEFIGQARRISTLVEASNISQIDDLVGMNLIEHVRLLSDTGAGYYYVIKLTPHGSRVYLAAAPHGQHSVA